MKIYRTRRYNSEGGLVWERYSDSRYRYSATRNDLRYGASVTLERADIDDSEFQLVASYDNFED